MGPNKAGLGFGMPGLRYVMLHDVIYCYVMSYSTT